MSGLTEEQCMALTQIDGTYPILGREKIILDGDFTAEQLRNIAVILDPPKAAVTRKFKGYIQTDKVGSTCEFEFEVADDATEEQIEEVAREHAFDRVNWSFDEVK